MAIKINKLSSFLLVFLLLFTAPALYAQDISSAIFMSNGEPTASPTSPERVAVFSGKPTFAFRIIGTIEATGMASYRRGEWLLGIPERVPTERDDFDLALNALKVEAAANGADAVVIVNSMQIPYETGTARRLNGVAIVKTY